MAIGRSFTASSTISSLVNFRSIEATARVTTTGARIGPFGHLGLFVLGGTVLAAALMKYFYLPTGRQMNMTTDMAPNRTPRMSGIFSFAAVASLRAGFFQARFIVSILAL